MLSLARSHASVTPAMKEMATSAAESALSTPVRRKANFLKSIFKKTTWIVFSNQFTCTYMALVRNVAQHLVFHTAYK